MVSRRLFTDWLEGSSVEIRSILDELEGVSPETLERIDIISRPSGDGPVPRFQDDVQLYERLVLRALAEHARARQQAAGSAPKVTKAS